MAIKLFELGYVIKAIDKVSAPLRNIREQFEGLDQSAKLLTGMGLDQVGEQVKSFGEGVLGGVESVVEAASETQSVLAKLGAVSGYNAEQLDRAREAAEAFSSVHLGSTDEFIEILRQAAPVFHGEANAIDAATQAMKLHAATGIDAGAALNLFTETGRAFGNSASQIAGTFAAVTKIFGVTNLDAVSSSFGRLAGATLAAKGNAAEALGVMAEMQHILGPEGAGRAAMALSEVLTHGAKYGIDTQHGLVNALDQVRTRLATMGHTDQIEYLSKVFGAGQGVRLLPLIEETGMLRENLAKVAAIAPNAVAGMEGINEATYAAKIQIFGQAWQNLKDALGNTLLGKLKTLLDTLTAGVKWVKNFADNHQTLTKYLLIFAGVAGVAAVAVGTLLTVFGSIAIVIATVTGLAAGWAIAIAIGVIAAVAAVIAFWPQIKNFFVKTIPEAFQWGVNLLKTFAKGIESAAMWPIHAIEGVLTKLCAYLPFSPAKLGPLRDLNRIRLVETIAETIRPSPIVAAMQRTALATMIAAPMMLGGIGTAGAAPVQVVINYSPTINGGSADEWEKSARRHAAELTRIIQRELERQDRRSY